MPDYEIEIGSKTYEMHSDKPLTPDAIQGVVTKFKKQASASQRPAVSTTNQKVTASEGARSQSANPPMQGHVPGITIPPSSQSGRGSTPSATKRGTSDSTHKKQSSSIDNSSGKNTGRKLTAAEEEYNRQVIAYDEMRRKHDRELLAPLYAVADPLQNAVALGMRGIGHLFGNVPSKFQQDVDRVAAKRGFGSAVAAQGAGPLLQQADPDTHRRIEALPDTGIQGFSKGLHRALEGFSDKDNILLGIALAHPAVAGNALIGKAIQGVFGVEAAKSAAHGLIRYQKSGFKDTAALGEAAASATMGAAIAHHAVGGKAGLTKAVKTVGEKVRGQAAEAVKPEPSKSVKPKESPLAKAAAKDPLVAEKPPIRKPNPKPKEDPVAKREREKARTTPKQGATKPVQATTALKVDNQPPEKAAQPETKPAVKTAKKQAKPETPKPEEKANAVQEQSAAPSVPRKERSKVELRGVGEGDAQKATAGKKEVKAEVKPRYEVGVEFTDAEGKRVKYAGQDAASGAHKFEVQGGKHPVTVYGTEPYLKGLKPAGKSEVAPKDFLDFIDRQPKGRVYTKASDLFAAFKKEHPDASREQFGQMLQHAAASPDHEIVTPSANLPERDVFTFKDSTGIERRVAGVRPAGKKPTSLTPDEAATLALQFPEGHSFGDALLKSAESNKPHALTEAAEKMARQMVENKKLDKGKFPTLFPGEKPQTNKFGGSDTRGSKSKKYVPPVGRSLGMVPEADLNKRAAELYKSSTPEAKKELEQIVEELVQRVHEEHTQKRLDDYSAKMKTPEGKAELEAVQKKIREEAAADLNRFLKSKKDIAIEEKGPQELGTFNPLRAVLGDERYEEVNKKLSDLYHGTRATFNPGGFDEHSRLNARIGRDYLAQRERQAEARNEKLKIVRHAFDRMVARTPGQAVRFMFNMEGGNTHADPAAQSYGDVFRQMLDDTRADVQKLDTGALDFYIENYFPHIWKDPQKAAQVLGAGKAPLQGSKAFLKQRTIPTIEEGMFPQGAPANLDTMSMKEIRAEVKRQGGLEPLSYNPSDLVQLKLQEMDRYIFGQKWFAEMKDKGLARFVRFGQKAPDGYIKIDDKIARVLNKTPEGTVIRGEWMAPEGAARIMNNHLTPGIGGHPTIGPAFRAINYLNNSLNMAQLGLSGFHATTTSLNSIIGENARAFDLLTSGKPIRALKAAATAPVAPLRDYWQGSKVLKEYRSAGTVGGDIPAIVDSLVKGGGRVTLAKEFRLNAMEKFGKAVRQRDIRSGVMNALPAALESTMAPLMRDAVPRLKLGAFAELMRDELRKAGPYVSSVEYQRELASRAWDSIENRFGQLNYDNLFWDKSFQDAGHLAVRSLGWNLGTLRELGGAVPDTLTTRSRMRGGGRLLTPRMAYTMSLVYTTAVAGAIYGYLHGHPPKTPEDYFFPMGPDGKRVQLPTYMKDVRSYAKDPIGTVYNKKSPLADIAIETLQNKDFFNKPLVNKEDSVVKQAEEYFRYLGKNLAPFSFRGDKNDSYGEVVKKTLTTQSGRERFFGITPVSQGKPAKKGRTSAIDREINNALRGATGSTRNLLRAP